MKKHLLNTLLVMGLLSVSNFSYAFLGAFWLGVNAKVNTTVKVDQHTLDVINNLPIELRKQAVDAANQTFDRLDKSIKDNSKLLSAEIERTSLQVAMQWECTGKSIVDKTFAEIRNLLPKWKLLSSKCERRYSPDRVGPGPVEKVKISDCWINEKLEEDSSPEILAAKMATLQAMSTDAACYLRQTAASQDMWKLSTEYGLRYQVWSELIPVCDDAKDCYATRLKTIEDYASISDKRDIGEAFSRINESKENASQLPCNRNCLERSLVSLYLAESEITRNKSIRNEQASIIIEQASLDIKSARSVAEKARDSAAYFNKLQVYTEQSASAINYARAAVEKSQRAIDTSLTVKPQADLISADANDVDAILSKAKNIYIATAAAEAERIRQEQAKKEESASKLLHCGGGGGKRFCRTDM